jgi:hypothetical protein
VAKAPHRNPYGEAEEPKRFRDFDICTKIRILHQLTVWTFWNPDRIKEKMAAHPTEKEQVDWVSVAFKFRCGSLLTVLDQRMEELGYDRDDRQYYVLDDNRFYRRTAPVPPPLPKAKPKANSKKAIAARRRESKRRKLEAQSAEPEEGPEENTEETELALEGKEIDSWDIDTFGGFKWECLCITLPEYQAFLETITKTKDPNEKVLRDRLVKEVMPTIQAAEEKRRRKIERREKELLMMEKMVGAKRSNRLADKQDRERREAEQAEVEKKRQADLVAARREQEKQEKMEQERQYRMMTREQRIKDREYKRLLKEEELARDEIEQKRIEEGQVRGSDRALKQRMERNKKELEDLEAEEDWTFDCSGCGVYGKNLVCQVLFLLRLKLTVIQDDGTHIISCERCNVWQHSKCLGISKSAAEKDDFHFICKDCRRKEEDAKKPKISLKLRVGTSSPAPPSPAPKQSTFVGVEVPIQQATRPSRQGSQANGYQSAQQSPYVNGIQPPQHQGSSPRNSPAFAQPQHLASGGRPILPAYQAIQPYPAPLSNGNRTAPLAQSSGALSSQQNAPHHQHSSQSPNQPSVENSSTPKRPIPPVLPNTQRVPSPVLNRPIISPTQGNYDVGPVAGIPQKASQSPPQQRNGVDGFAHRQQTQPHATPRVASQSEITNLNHTPISRAPNYPLSGLSPKKQPTPTPNPPLGTVPQKSSSMSPPVPSNTFTNTDQVRTVSGTAILPPVENLRPSPQQLRNSSSSGPVPTPSKQPQPQWQPHQGRASAERQVNEPALLANSVNPTPTGAQAVRTDDTPRQGTDGSAHVDLQNALAQSVEASHSNGNASHPEIRDYPMQDVQG